ncbi:MAG: hypothetical protein K2X27_02875 [Candidatus Obscuribacterales bacterium]|nr:hypothetical protein [Candidatus Obscuribacterales bacterium]
MRNSQSKLPGIFCITLLGAFLALPAADAAPTGSSPPKSSGSQKLHRADFRVSGASCVSCLRRVGKTIREQNGVIKGDVSIFKPYWAIVIYDSAKTNLDKIYESVKAEKIRFDEIEDKAIDSVPTIVIPKGIRETTPSSPH